MTWFGGIEAGGTKFVCSIADENGKIVEEGRFPTTIPDETIDNAIGFFQKFREAYPLTAIGIASFGPVDLDPSSETWGYITATPKPNWSDCNLAGRIRDEFNVPVGFDTDVNGAALGEHVWGAAQGLHTFIYYTIGTGIGGGGMMGGQIMHGLVHPEMGHIRIPHDKEKDPYAGHCVFHGDCFEGLASGPAVEERWGVSAETLPPDHPAWELEATYIAQAMVNTITMISPQRIILGGGIMQQSHLFPLIRRKVLTLLNNYVQHDTILEKIDTFIVPPKLGNQAGVLGAIALAIQASNSKTD